MELLLIEELRREEQSVLEALRATRAFQRLEALRQLLSAYEEPLPIGALLDAVLPDAHRLGPGRAESVIALPGPRTEVA